MGEKRRITLAEALALEAVIYARLRAEKVAARRAEAARWAWLDYECDDDEQAAGRGVCGRRRRCEIVHKRHSS